MEIVGIGSDIVECLRIARMIEQHGELFLTRVYTEWEIRSCRTKKHATEHYAGLWAAKESILKCLGTGWRKGLSWTDMEVRPGTNGQPLVHVCGAVKEQAHELRVANILLTISHCRAYATAYAIAVTNGTPPRAENDDHVKKSDHE